MEWDWACFLDENADWDIDLRMFAIYIENEKGEPQNFNAR